MVHVLVYSQNFFQSSIFNQQGMNTFFLAGTVHVVDVNRALHDRCHFVNLGRLLLHFLHGAKVTIRRSFDQSRTCANPALNN